MKFLCFNLILVFSNFLWGREVEKSLPSFKVQSDEFDKSISKNYYVLEGEIVDYYQQKEKIKQFEIQAQNQKKKSNKSSYFKLKLPVTSSYVIFSKKGYNISAFENYTIKAQHRIKVIIYMSEITETPTVVRKPVIYAYSSSDMDLSIQLKPVGKLMFTYPQISSSFSWNMSLKNNSFVDIKGNDYPYLFWDSEQLNVNYTKTTNKDLFGQIVRYDTVINFLDSILTDVGFNSKEKTDFITYWGPSLMKNNYNFIQFVTQEECSQFADYEISPKPEHFNRFYILFSGYEYYPDLNPVSQNLKPFLRDGFNILEWGGVEIKNVPAD